VAIAGSVSDAITGNAIAEVDITMTDTPASFTKKLGLYAIQFGAKWATMAERPDRTRSRVDGLFYFLDLPDGKYGLHIAAPKFGSRYGAVDVKATVARDAKGTFKLDWAIVGLPPTTVKGAITSPEENVCFAQVRVKGSGEYAFSDRTGRYLIAGIEPGQRTLLVSAQGFHPIAQPVLIEGPGAVQTMNFGLHSETGPAPAQAGVHEADIPHAAETTRAGKGRQHGGR
jgi:hypothetical protein